MEKLKPCPFCGGMPEFVDNSGEYYYINKMKSTPGRIFLRSEVLPYGSRGRMRNYHLFQVTDWQVHCSTKGCFARNLNKHYCSKEKAIEAWNRRTEDSGEIDFDYSAED